MSKKANLYVGHAGQMAVISEFLIRGWNVAVPEVARATLLHAPKEIFRLISTIGAHGL